MSDASKYDLLRHLRLSADISVPTLADLHALQTFRRKWGVSVYVYDDGVNTGTYKLTKGHSSDNPQDNLNWVKDASSGGGYEPKNSIEVDADELQLVGDEASPGNSKYYGTDGAGAKGFHDLPAGGSATPEYNPIPVFAYLDGKVIQTQRDIGGGKFIESRVAYHASGDNVGKADFIEIKDERTDPAIWVRETINYTNKVLTSTTVADIVAWTIII